VTYLEIIFWVLITVVNIFLMYLNNKRSNKLFLREKKLMDAEYAVAIMQASGITPEEFIKRAAEAAPRMERTFITAALGDTLKH